MKTLLTTAIGTMGLALMVWLVGQAGSSESGEFQPKKVQPIKLQPLKIKTDKHFKARSVHATVDWSYLRINHPEVVVGVVRNVQAGKVKRSALTGAANPKVLDAMLKTKWVGWMPESLAAKQWKPSVKPDSKRLMVGDYSAAQVKSANWATIVDNAKLVSLPSGDITLMPTYSPDQIDFGAGYLHTRSAVVTVTSPTAGEVKASWGPGNKEAFVVKRLTSYTGVLKNGQPTVDKSVLGSGTLTVKAGQDFIVEVLFNTQAHGTFTETLQIRGKLYSIDVPIKAKVNPEPPTIITLTIAPETNLINLVPGGSMLVGAKIKSAGGPSAEVVLEGISLPTGISMESVKVKGLLKNEERNITLKFNADPLTLDKAAIRMSQPGTVRATFAANKQFDLYFQFTVRQASWYWDHGTQEFSNNVFWQTWVWMSSDGSYHWHAHLWDDSTISGDSYVVGWYINFNLDNEVTGLMAVGELGSKWFGPARHAWIDRQGVNPKIGKYWPQIYDGNNVTFYANAFSNYAAALEWGATTGLKAYFGGS